MKNNGMDDVLLTGGGIMSDSDIEALMKMGVGRLFGPGASLSEAVQYIKDWYKNSR